MHNKLWNAHALASLLPQRVKGHTIQQAFLGVGNRVFAVIS